MSDNQPTRGGQRNRVQVELPADLRAVYANLALILHTPNEFFVDFAQLLPGMPKSQVHTRIAMTPTHAKLLYRALGENIERYEAAHGPIDVPPSLADQLFKGAKLANDPGPETNE